MQTTYILARLYSYRLEKRNEINIALENIDGQLEVKEPRVASPKDPEMELLDAIIASFNKVFGDIDWKERDKVERQIQELPAMVRREEAIENALESHDEGNIRLEYEALFPSIVGLLAKDGASELFAEFIDNPRFKKSLSDFVFAKIMQQRVRQTNTLKVLDRAREQA